MTRTWLAGLTLIGLLACGGKKSPPAARHTSAAPRPAAQSPSRSIKAQPRGRTRTTARDTTKRINPLTGH